ncbi:MAG: hypothetical protein AAF787_00270 [Chloroflexota bacterium]
MGTHFDDVVDGVTLVNASQMNARFNGLDAQIVTNTDDISGMLAGTTAFSSLSFETPTPGNRQMVWRTGSAPAGVRWVLGVNNAAESGGNAGSDFFFANYDDSGALISNLWSINRATSAFTIRATSVRFTGDSIGFFGAAAIAKPNVIANPTSIATVLDQLGLANFIS